MYRKVPFPFEYDDNNKNKNNYYLVPTYDGKYVRFNYCKICCVYRPPKTFHC